MIHKKKNLLYTTSDQLPQAEKCIELLLNSISSLDEWDFCILSNKKQESKFDVIIDESFDASYVGYLKYSSMIPYGYRNYVYMDYNFLYFDYLSNLMNKDNVISIIQEPSSKMVTPKYAVENNKKTSNLVAINSGCFTVKNLNIFKKIRTNIHIYKSFKYKELESSTKMAANLESSIFNKVIAEESDYNLSNFHIYEGACSFSDRSKISKKYKLYQFNNCEGNIDAQYSIMSEFYKEYNRLNKV